MLCLGVGVNFDEVKFFKAFCPNALAGLYCRMDRTLFSRCIVMEMQRKAIWDTVQRFYRRDTEKLKVLHDRAAVWAKQHVEALGFARPEILVELPPRVQDMWEPLLAIADRAGGDCLPRAHQAARALLKDRADDDADQSEGVQLLGDIARCFQTAYYPDGTEQWAATDRLSTSSLIVHLCGLPESSWKTYDRGNSITPAQLSKLLRPYRDDRGRRIQPKQVKIDGKNVRGYERYFFKRAWACYVEKPGANVSGRNSAPEHATDATGDISQGFSRDSQPATKDSVAGAENAKSTDSVRKVAGVAGSTPQFPTNDEQLSFEFAQAPPTHASGRRDALAGGAYNYTDRRIPPEGSSGAPTTLAANEIGGYAEDLFGYMRVQV